MYHKKLESDIRCPLEYGLEVFGGKWKSRVICVLADKKTLRYSELRAELVNITERVVGGSKINTAFLEAGLLDEISLLVGAGIDGRGSMPAVFDGLAMQHDVTKLKLIDVKKFDSDAVWIRYQCQKSRRQIINNMLR